MWLIPWSGRRDDARWDEIGRCREEREEKIKDFCSDDRRSDRFAGWCGRLARTGHARGISTRLREFRRSFAQEFHLGRNALGEYRETGYCSAFLTVDQMSSAKATSRKKANRGGRRL